MIPNQHPATVSPGFSSVRAGHRPGDSPVLVYVLADNQFGWVGVTGLLADRPGISLLPADQIARADVVVMVATGPQAQVPTDPQTPPGRTLLVLAEPDAHDRRAAGQAGIAAIISCRELTAAGLARLIHTTARAQRPVGPRPPQGRPSRSGRPVDVLPAPDLLPRQTPDCSGLTRREIDILRMIAEGLDTREIADRTMYSERTVKNIVYTITSRLNLRNRSHAVAYAIQCGAL